MELKSIRIRNYRSIGPEQYIPIGKTITLVGPNNAGKTNALRAIQVLFTGFDNRYGYSREVDLTFGVGNAQTSIVATFGGDPETEVDIYQKIDELHKLQGTKRKGSTINLTLYFTKSNTPVYSFFPNVKRPRNNAQATQYSRTHRALVNTLLSKFKVYYVPSAKSVEQLYDELLVPFLRQTVSEVIRPYVEDIRKSLNDAADSVNRELETAHIQEFRVQFSLPNRSVEELVSRFDLVVADPQETPASQKGMGIQTTALLAAFRWISQQEKSRGRTAIWLLEEPESYLHPALATHCNLLLENLAHDAIVVKTTHAMAFVPQDPAHIRGVRLGKDNHTEIHEFRTFAEATSSIRIALGVRFGDFYNLAQYNIFVEGPSDREIFQWLLEQIPDTQKKWEYLRQAKFEDFGGVTHLAGFLRATYQFIREERACVVVLDGDEAGERVRREIQGYFGNKGIPFEPNLHFVSVRSRFAIEGLFPDEWIIKMWEEHRDWFETFSIDSNGNLEPFTIKDGKKSQAQRYLRSLAERSNTLEWAERFYKVGDIIDEALKRLDESLSKTR